MNDEPDVLEPTNSGGKSGGMRMTLAMIILAFIAGIGVMAWAVSNWDFARNMLPQAPPAPEAVTEVPQSAPKIAQPLTQPLPGLPGVDVETRIAEVEARLARIGQSASVASDNAKRAEGLLLGCKPKPFA